MHCVQEFAAVIFVFDLVLPTDLSPFLLEVSSSVLFQVTEVCQVLRIGVLSILLPTLNTCGVVFYYWFRPNNFSNTSLALNLWLLEHAEPRELCDGQRNRTWW